MMKLVRSVLPNCDVPRLKTDRKKYPSNWFTLLLDRSFFVEPETPLSPGHDTGFLVFM